jgi:D-sedoheptulose 7-phosphate isomerase
MCFVAQEPACETPVFSEIRFALDRRINDMNSPDASQPNSSSSNTSSENTTEAILDGRIKHTRSVLDRLFEAKCDALAVMESIQAIVARKGRLFTCGNGGSAAQALHLAEELLGRYKADRPALPAFCLNADSTTITCIGNDYGYERIFARQIEALVQANDGLVVFSTSGRSANILEALDAAALKGARTIGFLGGDGGPALARCDEAVVIPGQDTAAIQDAHQTLLHACCELLEDA